jgi:hypothetical protein
MSRRILLIVLALASLGLTACGERKETITVGESEAEFVTLGELQYQVQLSRQLNPAAQGDRDLLVGVAPSERGLQPDEIWFGVWLRALNGTEAPQELADEFTIKDTTGTEFEPVDNAESVFAWRPGLIEGGGVYPALGSASANSPTTGAILLFKMPVATLDFRPLEFEFGSSELPDRISAIRLDV